MAERFRLVALLLACAALVACATRPPPPVTAPPVAADLVRATATGMTLREKIAQQFIVWIPRGADREALDTLKALRPGGYILYPWNYQTASDVRALTADLGAVDDGDAATTDVRPFIAVDQEGGRVAAFRFPEFPAAPSAYLLGSLGDPAIVEASAHSTALELAWLGCNLNLAPVADLYPRADATIIGDRSYGPDPAATAASVAACVRGLRRGGIIPTLKHFPGHGATTVDSHLDLPVVQTGVEGLESGALVPFVAGIRAGAPVVMTAHILYPAIDAERPATLSAAVLKGLLRRDLGFEGIILTDGFEMGALSNRYGKEEALASAFAAGVTQILLYSRYDPREMIDMVEGLVRDGKLPLETIDANVARILEVKRDYGLLGGR
jgi:beta-N-acetylhexosaminidase